MLVISQNPHHFIYHHAMSLEIKELGWPLERSIFSALMFMEFLEVVSKECNTFPNLH